MSKNLSVLQRATEEHVRLSPFPYLVIENALPADTYQRLADSFPSRTTMNIPEDQNNFRWDYAAPDVASNPGIPEIWKVFIAYHSSGEFFQELVTYLYPGIAELYGKRYPDIESLKTMRAGIRNVGNFETCDVLMEAMISGNTPVQTASSVRTTHVDLGNKLFSGLFYMRRPEDDSVGGDLTISCFKQPFDGSSKRFELFHGPYVDDNKLDVVDTVKYAANTVVLFINSLESLHGVTVRQPTTHPRLFVNLIGEVNPPLYKLGVGKGKPARYCGHTPALSVPQWLSNLWRRQRRLLL